MMMLKFLVLALMGRAEAQKAPTIEDLLKDSSNTVPAPGQLPPAQPVQQPPAAFAPSSSSVAAQLQGPAPAAPAVSGVAAPAVSPGGSIGGILGAMAASSGAANQKPDMFGRQPSSNPIGDLLGGGGGAKTSSSSPIMDTLLKSVEAKMPMNQKLAAKQPGAASSPAAISQQSKDIVAGIVTAFMHNVQLLPGEKQCLENNIATLVFDVVGAATDLADGIKAIMAGQGSPNTPQAIRSKSQGTMVSAGLDGAMKLTSLVTMATSLLKNCVQGDALEMLRSTGRHFIDMRYVSHRLLVSGVDIAHRLSDGVIAYEAHDWHRFGQDIGIAIRKVLLSNATKGSRLPEGVPESVVIEQTTEGVMSGFFVRGSGVEITDTAVPDVDIQLDLHRCIAGNREFFKEVWLAMWNFIAQLSMTADGAITNPFDGAADGAQPKWMGELMIAMMQVPVALSKCNIGQEAQQMLMEAVKSIKYLNVHFLFPKHMITAHEATHRMAKAVQSWTNWDFKGFGMQIGELLREFVLLMYPEGGSTYPQQYSVDAGGRLRRQLILKSAPMQNIKVVGQRFSPTVVALSVGGLASSILVAMVVVRSIRSMSHSDRLDASVDDCEAGSDADIEVE